jgi:hypothetical protein
MPLPIKPDIDWYKVIEETLIKARQLANNNQPIVLRFMQRPVVRAFISVGPSIFELPHPVTPGAYKNWRNWFSGYLQPLIKQMADAQKMTVYIENNNGHLLSLQENQPPEYYLTD